MRIQPTLFLGQAATGTCTAPVLCRVVGGVPGDGPTFSFLMGRTGRPGDRERETVSVRKK